ncbi:hypothetical protein D3C87_1971470 [compost metagenome]
MDLNFDFAVRMIKGRMMLPPLPVTQDTLEVFLLHIPQAEQQCFCLVKLLYWHQEIKVTRGAQRNITVQILCQHGAF